MAKRFLIVWSLAFLMIISNSSFAELTLNMSPGVTPVSRATYDLHMTILWICVAIGIGVFGVMFWAIIFHRKSKGAVSASFHENTTLEIFWTTVPFFLLIIMAVPATKTLLFLENTDDSELTVKVTGQTWLWHYEYVGEGVKYASEITTSYEERNSRDAKKEHYLRDVDNPLVLPINKKVRILTTSNDVIHSWWVPEFAVKKDAIPGFINETWTKIEVPGTYRGQCAELCGKNHGFMPIVVEAKTAEEFQKWLDSKKKG